MKITRFTYSQSWYVAMKSNNNLWWTMWREFSQLFPFFTTFLLLLLLLLLAFLLLFLLLVRLGELLLKSTKLICMYKYAGTISSKHPQWQTAIASKSKLSTFANAHRPLNEHGGVITNCESACMRYECVCACWCISMSVSYLSICFARVYSCVCACVCMDICTPSEDSLASSLFRYSL